MEVVGNKLGAGDGSVDGPALGEGLGNKDGLAL